MNRFLSHALLSAGLAAAVPTAASAADPPLLAGPPTVGGEEQGDADAAPPPPLPSPAAPARETAPPVPPPPPPPPSSPRDGAPAGEAADLTITELPGNEPQLFEESDTADEEWRNRLAAPSENAAGNRSSDASRAVPPEPQPPEPLPPLSSERESGYRPVPERNPSAAEAGTSLRDQYPITVVPPDPSPVAAPAPEFDTDRGYDRVPSATPQPDASARRPDRPRTEGVALSNSVWDTTYTSVTGHLVRGEVRFSGNGGTVLGGEGRFSNLTFTPAANGRPARIAGDWVMNGFTGTVAWDLLTADMTNGPPRLEGSWTLTGGPPGTWRRTGSWNGTLAADQNAPPDTTATILAEPTQTAPRTSGVPRTAPAPQSNPAPQAAPQRRPLPRRFPRLFRRRGN
ncbi:hypothetical protein [Alienimonas sp. DA493]|uniref:hypothetical protein n=1 Tax=Alienimonas sp. DA493 TaxID=3373605 RepID=UPI0037540410